MNKQDRKEKKNKFTSYMQKKLVVLYLLVLLAFAGLTASLVLINRDATPMDDAADLVIHDKVGQVLSAITATSPED